MKTKSRSRIKHAVLVLVALAGLSFSLAAAAEDGKIERNAGGVRSGNGNLGDQTLPMKPGDKIEF